MNNKKYALMAVLLAAGLLVTVWGCQKGFLETKPEKALLVPTRLADFRALLNNLQVFNRSPGLTGIADGDLYTTDAGLRAFAQEQERNSYIWAADIYGSQTGFEWNSAYEQVLYANVVLEGISGIPGGPGQKERNEIEGTALYNRALIYYYLTQLYCKPYDAATAGTDLGVPVRTSPDVTQIVQRGTLEETYGQIFRDLARARSLLPLTAAFKTYPTLAALYGLLARVYLVRGAYGQAGIYADSALQRSSTLLDFNTLVATATRPMPVALPNANPEILLYVAGNINTFNGATAVAYIDPALYASYAANDLRRTCFFRDQGAGRVNFKGSFTGAAAWFTGLTAGEMLLIRAECAARAGRTAAAMADLNALLVKRWKSGTFVPLAATDAEAALRLVLAERRKELVGRNMRWSDLRRLNSDPRFTVTLTRTIGGVTYTLEPGSRRYVYPIPEDERRFSGLVQNER